MYVGFVHKEAAIDRQQNEKRLAASLTVDNIVVFPLSGGPTNRTAFPRDFALLLLKITSTMVSFRLSAEGKRL